MVNAWVKVRNEGWVTLEAIDNAFCATGSGGGVDPSCGKDTGGEAGQSEGKDGYHQERSAKEEVATVGAGSKFRAGFGETTDDTKTGKWSEGGKQTIGKVSTLLDAAKASFKGIAKAAYDSLPKPLQKVVDVAQRLEHGAAAAYEHGQQLAKEVAREQGHSDEHVERIGRVLAAADTVARNTQWLAVHPVAEALTGPVGGFVASKASYFTPTASLLYVAAAMGRATLSGKNPIKMVAAARERVKSSMAAKKAAGPAHNALAESMPSVEILDSDKYSQLSQSQSWVPVDNQDHWEVM